MAKMFTKNGDEYEEIDGFTQDEVDHIIEKRVARERQKYTDYDDLKSQVTDLGAKLKAANDEKTELEKKLGAAELATDRVKILQKYNVPENLHEFVNGATKDDMAKQAEKLAESIKGGKVPITKTPKPEGNEKTDSTQIANKLFGKKSED
nr:MAG TPA: Major head protein [Caudoviricetes sp.]